MVQRIKDPQKLPDRFDQPDSSEASFVVCFEGWADDLARLHASLGEHAGARDWQLVVIDLPGDDEASGRIAALERVKHVPLRQPVGWAAARNLGLRVSAGRTAIVIDTSVEVTGDLLAGVEPHLDDPSVGLVGRWGVVTTDGFNFTEHPGPDVDGVEAYLMAARRSVWREVGGFHSKFRFYRNADLDTSFRFRDAGYRTVVDSSLPVVRHAHRVWESTAPDEREERSRKNFFRFRDHWAERIDLFVHLGKQSP